MIKKALQKLSLFFLLNLVPCNEKDYKKRIGPKTSTQSLFKLKTSSEKFIY